MTSQQYQMSLFEESDVWTLSVEISVPGFQHCRKQTGFEDTRGSLFFEIARFASILRPKYLLANVKGLLNHDGGATFETILGALDELGYNVEWQILNSKDFGVPQNRENGCSLSDILERMYQKSFSSLKKLPAS